MGAATAWALARKGHDVEVLEQHRVGHARGSSHGRARIFRLSYGDSAWVRRAQAALALWRTVEEEVETKLIRPTGGVDLGPAVGDHADALAACGVDYELLSGAEARRRFPVVAFPEGPVLVQPDAGVIRAERAWHAFLSLARAGGARLQEEERVEEVEPRESGVILHTVRRTLRAEAAVVTAGPWAQSLLAPSGIDVPVQPTRETVAFFSLDQEEEPPPLVEWTNPARYSLPSPGEGLKAGEHQAGPPVHPDEEGGPDQKSVYRLSAWVQDRFPRANPLPHRVETCFYTNAEDDRFLMERHGPIVVGSPCSGHGFKFAPWVGTRLALLAIEG